MFNIKFYLEMTLLTDGNQVIIILISLSRIIVLVLYAIKT